MANLYHEEGLLSECKHHVSSDFVTSCMHKVCRQCLKSDVESVLKKSRLRIQPSYDDIKVQLMCPNQRCGMELSEEDLVNLVGINMVKEYENQLLASFNHLYGTDIANCLKCNKKGAIKSPMMASSKKNENGKTIDEVNRFRNSSIACKSIEGLKTLRSFLRGKAKFSDKVNRFQNSTIVGFMQYPESWECQNCDFAWCPACGSAFESGKASHKCREETNYVIKNIVSNLKSIYNDYTGGNRKVNRQYCRKISNVWRVVTGFGGAFNLSYGSAKKKVRMVEMQHDCRTETVLKFLTSFLKNKTINQPQPVIGFSEYVLLGSDDVLIKLLAILVMNDSIMDICARGALYVQMAELLETMATCRQLLRLINGSSFNTDRKENFDIHAHNTNEKSIINKMKNVYEQSKILVHRFEHEKQEKQIDANIDIARHLIKCYEKLAIAAGKTMPIVEKHSKMKGHSGDTSNQISSNKDGSKMDETKEICLALQNKTLYKESLKPLQFGEYPMLEKTLLPHTYSRMFGESGSNMKSIDNNGEHNKKRMLHITKEIALLATNLPLEWESSIHLRVDPVRMDFLKALIVGPKGTPYQNGIFVFDIYLPPDYPQAPPQVKFLTTGCGKVRFNPNLYANGRVCLSLLGTWTGPGWQPWKSTILQVLVSLQGLVFVEYPYYNEPFTVPFYYRKVNNVHPPAAEEENKIHRCNTLKYAILDALKKPDDSFKDVIMTHFRHKKQEILEQCDEWVGAARGSSKHINTIAMIARDVKSEVSRI